MSSVASLATLIGLRIGDPNGDELIAPTGATDPMLLWIDMVVKDAAMMTDCLQVIDLTNVVGDATSDGLSMATLTRPYHILSVSDRTSKVVYRSVNREDYQGYYNQIVGGSTAGMYVWNLFGYDTNQKLYVLPIVANAQALAVEYSQFAETVAFNDDAMPGLLDDMDSLIVEGVATIYFHSEGDTENARTSFDNYIVWVKKLGAEIGVNPVINPEMSSLYRFIGEKMKELKG